MTAPIMPHTPTQRQRPVPTVLCILDGWGAREAAPDNAIAQARTPHWDRLVTDCPNGFLDASERHVGLPQGQMGNSEVGHMTIGGGRAMLQDLPRIDRAVATGELARNPELLRFIRTLRQSGGTAHVMGLLSPGGVHSHQAHMLALTKILVEAGVPVQIHGFLDGRDTPPRSATGYLNRFLADLPSGARMAGICGRYFAMDRDAHWERIEPAWRMLVHGRTERTGDAQTMPDADALTTLRHAYGQGVSDEFLPPVALDPFQGMQDGDGLLMANFRADRARQILAALIDPDFDGFARDRLPHFAAALGMVEYSERLNHHMRALFPPEPPGETLGAVVAAAGLRQLRIAETEKYAHVTFFFNGGQEAPFAGEERILVPSPRVATYDLQPEMSAPQVTDHLVNAITDGGFDFIAVNYANADMVGHTGKFDAAVTAVEALDHCLGRLLAAVHMVGGVLFITADHGNAEMMASDGDGDGTNAPGPHTAHTLNRVPALLVNYAGRPGDAGQRISLADGSLADIAPTLLEIMGLAQPAGMQGRSLIRRIGIGSERTVATADGMGMEERHDAPLP